MSIYSLDRFSDQGSEWRRTTVPKAVRNYPGLLWLDLELTGLDLDKDTIVEVAVVFSNRNLTHFIKGPNMVIHTDPTALNPWCTAEFSKNGLMEEMQKATNTVKEVEDELIAFLDHCQPAEGGNKPFRSYLAGSSIHVDRRYLCKFMPRLIEKLHHQIVDVSSVLLLGWSWNSFAMRKSRLPILRNCPPKASGAPNVHSNNGGSGGSPSDIKECDNSPSSTESLSPIDSQVEYVLPEVLSLVVQRLRAEGKPTQDVLDAFQHVAAEHNAVGSQLASVLATATDPSVAGEHRAQYDVVLSIRKLLFCKYALFKLC